MENHDQQQNLGKEMAKMDGKNENVGMKRKLFEHKQNLSGKKQPNSSIWRRALPAELLNELFGSLPFQNAFVLLTKMPNGLLARNAQKIINSIKEAMKNNKLNAEDCGSGLTISDEGLTANHSGPDKWYCIRTVLPIPTLNLKIDKPIIAIYFEAILNFQRYRFNNIGFCDRHFPLEGKWLGFVENSIGIWRDRIFYSDKRGTKAGNEIGYISKGDVVGLGIILQPNSKLECFATSNGKLLGKKELAPKFANFQLFPAFDLCCTGDSVRVNFGKQEWQFKEFQSVLH